MGFDFWIISFSGYLTIFLSAMVFLQPKLTVKNVTMGWVAITAQTLILWALSMFIPEVVESQFANLVNYIIFVPLTVVLYYYSRDFLYGIYCLVLAILVNNIALVIVYTQVHLFVGMDIADRRMQLLITVLLSLSEVTLAIIVKKSFTRFTFFATNRTFMRHLSILVLILSIVATFFIANEQLSVNAFRSDIIFLMVVIPAVILLAFWQLRMFYKKESEAYKEQYVREVETQQLAIRSFRHDYINLLLTMDQYLKEDDLAGLKQYFDDEIMPTRNALINQDVELGNLGQLQVKEIKSLLSVKIMEAQSLGIKTVVEIPAVVKKINMKSATLARVLGIFLDNAIEECMQHHDARLLIAMIEKADYQLIVVKNTCKDEMPTVKQIFEKSFSTKGEVRGLGLFNVRQLLDKVHHASLATTISEGYFVQELKIKQED